MKNAIQLTSDSKLSLGLHRSSVLSVDNMNPNIPNTSMLFLSANRHRTGRKQLLTSSKKLLQEQRNLSPQQSEKEKEASYQRFQDFKERMKSQMSKNAPHLANGIHSKQSSVVGLARYSEDIEDESSDSE